MNSQEPRRPRERSGLALVLLTLLFLGTVVLGAWIYYTFLRSDDQPAAQPPDPTTTVVTVTSQPAAPPVTTVTSTEATTEAPTFRAPEQAVQCAANVHWRIFRATDQTSCAFAENVAIAMAPHAGANSSQDIEAASPVTGQSYRMTCRSEGGNSYTCRGGDNAVVVLEDRAVRD
ncbi:hypothetical protein [Corynebacterium sp.]|uniref:hypothetical protein n=1 Tax=Corynebacterium sp. TaxID=1720 RepID=UPI0026DFCAB3|nr:hypothetical protein [Corynebacterium sp.]MDO5512847.1 hypothetical protein [Corynebacterium sp.]